MQIRRIFSTGGFELAILACGLISGVLVARVLGPDDRGLLAAILFWPHLVSHIGLFSLHEATAMHSAKGNLSGLAPSASVLAFALAVCSALLGAAALPWLMTGDKAAALALGIAMMLAFVPLNAVGLVLLGFEQGQHRFTRYNLLRLSSPLIYLVALIGFWSTGALALNTAVLSAFFGGIIVAVLGTLLLRSPLRARPSRHTAAALMRTGGRFHVHSLASYLSQHLDRLIVIPLLGSNDIGIYAVAVSLSIIPAGIVMRSVYMVTMPMLAAADTAQQRARSLRVALLLTTLGACGASALLIAISPQLIPWLFGTSFSRAVDIAIPLLVAGIPFAIRGAMVQSLKGLHLWRPGVGSELATIVGFAASAAPLWQQLGLPGLAWAMAFANLCGLVIVSPIIVKYLRPLPDTPVPPR